MAKERDVFVAVKMKTAANLKDIRKFFKGNFANAFLTNVGETAEVDYVGAEKDD